MNYSDIRQSYAKANKREIDNMGSMTENYYADKTNLFGSEPEFMLYQEDKFYDNKNRDPNEMAITATKGIINGVCEDNEDPLTQLFFSPENMKRINKMIKREISIRTNGKYRLDVDQNNSDLLIVMRAVFFDMYGARFLPFKIIRQVKELNVQVVNYVLPDMISQMKQEYGYLKEINQPLQTIMRPLNVNNKGRLTLPSITTIWGV